MNIDFKHEFNKKWNKYFPEADLPLCFYFSAEVGNSIKASVPSGWRCMIADLKKVMNGKDLAFDKNNIGCNGGKRYAGFTQKIHPDFNYFLSCGIPGKLEGERYKKTPHLVDEFMADMKFIDADQYLIFKRWDKLTANDQPDVAVFFANPEVMSGLFTLTNFDSNDPYAVITPFSSGCGSIIQYPYFESKKENPKAVIGMFDTSARPYVPLNTMTFSVSVSRLKEMTKNMDESFLITDTWKKMQQRMTSVK